ncbi:MAG: hypothetical protein R2747_20845 [Pyrinomonadaceae bacterium]
MGKDVFRGIKFFSAATEEKSEFESGVVIERRNLLWLPVLAASALIFAPSEISARKPAAEVFGSMTWDEFLKECLPRAGELRRDTTASGQDAYLFWIASLAARLDGRTIPAAKLGKFKDLDPAVEFGVGYRGVPFFVVEWKMAPGAIHPPHNHPNVSVCTVGLEGEARIRNFEAEREAPEFSSKEKFRVRQTHDQIISAGRINTLSARRDNIHTFEVGKDGARGIDITTFHGENIGFSFLEIRPEPLDAGKRLFEANWKKL